MVNHYNLKNLYKDSKNLFNQRYFFLCKKDLSDISNGKDQLRFQKNKNYKIIIIEKMNNMTAPTEYFSHLHIQVKTDNKIIEETYLI